MKILLSNKFFYPRGGDCIHTIQLKQLLEAHGHQVAIFSMQYPENIQNQYSNYWASEVNFLNKSYNELFSAVRRPFGVNEVKKKWNQLLKDFKPDIIHIHNIHSQISPIIAQLSKKQNIPVIWTLHDYKLICPASAFHKGEGSICIECIHSPSSVIIHKCIKKNIIASFLGYLEAIKWNKNKLQSYTNKFIAPSNFLKIKMLDSGYNSDKIVQLYNFADVDKFQNEVIQIRKTQVVYVGRISIEKGIESLCKAFEKITDAELIIIGNGPLKSVLENKYASRKIQFIGFQPWTTIKKKLEQASFMVIPSEWYENNPLTIIEAFALGTPVLGANIGGIPELIQDRINGMTFESGNIQDLTNQIEKMLNFKQWNYQQIQNDAKTKFSAKDYYDNIMKIYNQAILNEISQ